MAGIEGRIEPGGLEEKLPLPKAPQENRVDSLPTKFLQPSLPKDKLAVCAGGQATTEPGLAILEQTAEALIRELTLKGEEAIIQLADQAPGDFGRLLTTIHAEVERGLSSRQSQAREARVALSTHDCDFLVCCRVDTTGLSSGPNKNPADRLERAIRQHDAALSSGDEGRWRSSLHNLAVALDRVGATLEVITIPGEVRQEARRTEEALRSLAGETAAPLVKQVVRETDQAIQTARTTTAGTIGEKSLGRKVWERAVVPLVITGTLAGTAAWTAHFFGFVPSVNATAATPGETQRSAVLFKPSEQGPVPPSTPGPQEPPLTDWSKMTDPAYVNAWANAVVDRNDGRNGPIVYPCSTPQPADLEYWKQTYSQGYGQDVRVVAVSADHPVYQAAKSTLKDDKGVAHLKEGQVLLPESSLIIAGLQPGQEVPIACAKVVIDGRQETITNVRVKVSNVSSGALDNSFEAVLPDGRTVSIKSQKMTFGFGNSYLADQYWGGIKSGETYRINGIVKDSNGREYYVDQIAELQMRPEAWGAIWTIVYKDGKPVSVTLDKNRVVWSSPLPQIAERRDETKWVEVWKNLPKPTITGLAAAGGLRPPPEPTPAPGGPQLGKDEGGKEGRTAITWLEQQRSEFPIGKEIRLFFEQGEGIAGLSISLEMKYGQSDTYRVQIFDNMIFYVVDERNPKAVDPYIDFPGEKKYNTRGVNVYPFPAGWYVCNWQENGKRPTDLSEKDLPPPSQYSLAEVFIPFNQSHGGYEYLGYPISPPIYTKDGIEQWTRNTKIVYNAKTNKVYLAPIGKEFTRLLTPNIEESLYFKSPSLSQAQDVVPYTGKYLQLQGLTQILAKKDPVKLKGLERRASMVVQGGDGSSQAKKDLEIVQQHRPESYGKEETAVSYEEALYALTIHDIKYRENLTIWYGLNRLPKEAETINKVLRDLPPTLFKGNKIPQLPETVEGWSDLIVWYGGQSDIGGGGAGDESFALMGNYADMKWFDPQDLKATEKQLVVDAPHEAGHTVVQNQAKEYGSGWWEPDGRAWHAAWAAIQAPGLEKEGFVNLAKNTTDKRIVFLYNKGVPYLTIVEAGATGNERPIKEAYEHVRQANDPSWNELWKTENCPDFIIINEEQWKSFQAAYAKYLK